MSETDFHDWVDQLDAEGALLLNELHGQLTRYVAFPSAEAADAVTLFIAASHAQMAWEHATRLVVKSPLKRCGKTRLQEVIRETVHRPLPTVNISSPALVRSIDPTNPPTLILDEADTVFGKKASRPENAEDIRGIINSGHSRGWPYIRWDITTRSREEIPTFAMAVVGGIGDMPDTIEDRAVVVAMRRRAPTEQVASWRRRRSIPPLRDLRDRLHEWVTVPDRMDALSEAEPDLPVDDRDADKWEPLVAIADEAGGTWPDRARAACKMMVAKADPEDGTAAERLLGDLREVLGVEHQLPTAAILERLAAIEEAPWATWHRGDPLTARGLAGLLRQWGIRSRNLVIGDTRPKGYTLDDMADAFSRYLPLPATKDPKPQVELVADDVADVSAQSATEPEQPELAEVAPVADVADVGARPTVSRVRETLARHSASDYCRSCGMTSPGHTRSCRTQREAA